MNEKEKMLDAELERIKKEASLYKLKDKELGYFILLLDVKSGWSGTNSNMNDAGLIQILINYCKRNIVKIGD